MIQLNDGDSVLEYLQEVIEGVKRMPEIILLDINLPSLDGFEVLKRIHAQVTFQTEPRIMMTSGSKNPCDVVKAQSWGANDSQVKPISRATYIEFFNSLCT